VFPLVPTVHVAVSIRAFGPGLVRWAVVCWEEAACSCTALCGGRTE
jgi:hypothetical protein